jgi:hypothetical protein
MSDRTFSEVSQEAVLQITKRFAYQRLRGPLLPFRTIILELRLEVQETIPGIFGNMQPENID